MITYTKRALRCLILSLGLLLCNLSYSQSDFLFIVDNSGSISPSEFTQFAAIIEATGAELASACAASEFAIVHYGGSFGQEYTIQNDFIQWSNTTPVNRVYLDCVTTGTGDCGDDLPAAFASIDAEFGSGLNHTSGNDLIVVVFTDADGFSFAGVNMSPCTFAACSTLLPTTPFDSFVMNQNVTSSYVLGVIPTSNVALLQDYVYGNGTYTSINLNADPVGIAQDFVPDVECQTVGLGLAKDLTSLTNNNDGTYSIEFLFTIENFSNVPLNNLELNDDIVGQFSGFSPTNFTAINGSLNGSSSWNGSATSNILAAGQSVGVGGLETVSVSFDISHSGPATTIDNIATISGFAPDGLEVMDTSTDGLDTDPNDDGQPNEQVPTPTMLPETPMVGLAKDLTDLSNNMDGTYTVEFLFTVENFSTFALSNLELFDDIVGQFGAYSPSNYMTINGSLNGSSSWNGTSMNNILVGGQSIAAGAVETVSVKFDIIPTGVMGTIFNTATVHGTSPDGQEAIDESYDGLDPDPDGNDSPEEKMPTPVVLPEFSMVSGTIWKDVNFDGLKDPSEDGVFKVKVDLTDCMGNFVATTFSDMNGNYSFSNIYPGQFQMEADLSQLPPGCGFTLPDVGNDESIDSDFSRQGETACFNIIPGDNVIMDGGLYPPGVCGLAKNLTSATENADGTIDVEMLLTIENFSAFPLVNLELTDDIISQFGLHAPTNFMAIDGSLMSSASWDGTATSNILLPGQSIGAGAVETASIAFTILPDGISEEVTNHAMVSGEDPNGEKVEDVSTDGLDADPNGNMEPTEELPTIMPLPTFGKIGNYVWEDCNGDGRSSFNESGMTNVTVNLYTTSGNLYATEQTDLNGNYIFSQVRPGSYYLEFVAPNGYTSTFSGKGNMFNDSNVDGSSGVGTTPAFTVVSGECNNSYDAGFYQCVEIGERVFYDTNRNDLADVNENGINGILVELLRMEGNSFESFMQTFTAHKPGTPSDDGYFKFCAPPGIYRIQFHIPPVGLVPVVKDAAGFQTLGSANENSNDSDINNQSITNSFMASCNYDICNIGAGFYPMAQFGNRVWLDNNSDGVQNASEVGVAGIMIKAYDGQDQMIAETTSDVNGEYNIDYLSKDDYYLEFVAPSQYSFTTPNMVADDMDSDVTGENGAGTTSLYSLNPGDDLDNVDAGLMMTAVPLQWIAFTASAREIDNKLQWTTATEVNTSHFEIERALDHSSSFQAIGKLDASGNTQEQITYTFSDIDIDYNGVYFYRLKQYDLNGAFTYSDIVSLRRAGDNELTVYPNPMKEVVYIETNSSLWNELGIYDLSGKLIQEIKLKENKDLIEVDVESLPSGVYLLKAKIDNKELSKRLIKQ